MKLAYILGTLHGAIEHHTKHLVAYLTALVCFAIAATLTYGVANGIGYDPSPADACVCVLVWTWTAGVVQKATGRK